MTNQRPMPEEARQAVIEAFRRWLQENRPELTWRPVSPEESEELSKRLPPKPEKRGP